MSLFRANSIKPHILLFPKQNKDKSSAKTKKNYLLNIFYTTF